ncbi:hypothetical protein LCGC14_1560970, partial [marine sediment metagenome]
RTDYSYYKREITKLKATEKKQSKEETQSNFKQNFPTKLTYLSGEEKKQIAKLLEIPSDSIRNEKLYSTILEWMGTPYLFGGISQEGVDCSALTQQIYLKVYGKEIPRTSIQQFYFDTKNQFKSQKYLKQGDLIFFRLRYQDAIVSHVGIYLQNGKFLGSNSPRGVEITELDTNYWQDKYVASARLLNL